jgi:hypothetical protein
LRCYGASPGSDDDRPSGQTKDCPKPYREESNRWQPKPVIHRIAALVAVDAPPASYLLNISAAGDAGVDEAQIEGVLAAVAPIVGTTRVVSAVGNMARALDLKLSLAELGLGDE